jgi:hypothetical protein
MIAILRKKKYAKHGAIKAVDFALQGCRPNCETFVDQGGLKVRNKTKRKEHHFVLIRNHASAFAHIQHPHNLHHPILRMLDGKFLFLIYTPGMFFNVLVLPFVRFCSQSL